MIDLRVVPGELRVDEVTDLAVELTNRGAEPYWTVALDVRLSPALGLLDGEERLEVPRLKPGETERLTLRVRPHEEGESSVDVTELSFRDARGGLRRLREERRTLRVLPPRVEPHVPPPTLHLEVTTRELPLGEWSSLEGTVTHRGGAALGILVVGVAGPVTVDRDPPWESRHLLESGGKTTFRFPVRCSEPGEHVPLRFEVAFRDVEGRTGVTRDEAGVSVRSRPPADEPGHRPHPETVSILMVTANPDNDIRTEDEQGALLDVLDASGCAERFVLRVCPAAHPERLVRMIHAVEPRIVHFSSHGTRETLVLMDGSGRAAPVESAVIEELFRLLTDRVECVVLNACDSEDTARRIGRHIPYVIGMNTGIQDASARHFTIGFYQALAGGREVERAFGFGRLQIGLQRSPGMTTPVLFRNGEWVDPERIGAFPGDRQPQSTGSSQDAIQAE